MAMSTTREAAPEADGNGGLVGQYLKEARKVEETRRAKKKLRTIEAFPFWPHEAVRGMVIVLAFSAALIFASALMPYFLEKPANPAGQPEVILPDWYLLWSYGLLKPGVADPITFNGDPIVVPGLLQIEQALGPLGNTDRAALNAKEIGIVLNIVIMIPLIVLPFLSKGNPRRPQESPWLAAFGCAGIVYVFNASVYSINNVILTKIGWWGSSLLQLTPVLHAAKAAEAGWLPVLAGWAFWILPLPIASYLVRRYLLREPPRLAAKVSAISVVILALVLAYAAGFDLANLARSPLRFLADALDGTNLLAWVVWWSTLLAFEVAYWALVAWKQWAAREEHYEHGLNLTYYKVR